MREGLTSTNPVVGTNDPAEGIEPRDRVLAPDELKTIWKQFRDDDFGRIARLLLLTACRRDEIGGLRWSEVDLETGKLLLPKDRTKNGRPLALTLPEAARSILDYSSGTGILTRRLFERIAYPVGILNVDASSKFLRVALESFRDDDRVAFRLLRWLKEVRRLQTLDEVAGPRSSLSRPTLSPQRTLSISTTT